MMAPKEVYRDIDYDVDPFIEKTASWPDGLHEEYRFLPHFEMKMRRTSSTDDIARYERYFQLAQKNQGRWFTWRHYLKILRDDLRHFDTIVLLSRMLLQRIGTPVNSEISNYVTASDSDSSKKKKTPSKSRWRKRSFLRKEVVGGDAESISSMDSNLSITPQTNLLKKMCTEIRTLALKTCKTVDKMSSKKSKYCSGCGDYMGSNSKLHKKCPQSFGHGTPYCRPLTPGVKNVTSIMKTRSKTFISPVKGGGECSMADPQCSKTTYYRPDMECRLIKSFTKQQGKGCKAFMDADPTSCTRLHTPVPDSMLE